MYNDKHANKSLGQIDKYTALLIFWNNGWNTDSAIQHADQLLDGLNKTDNNYFLADDVVALAHNL